MLSLEVLSSMCEVSALREVEWRTLTSCGRAADGPVDTRPCPKWGPARSPGWYLSPLRPRCGRVGQDATTVQGRRSIFPEILKR